MLYELTQEYRKGRFEPNAKRYVKATREGRLLCSIKSRAKSGLSLRVWLSELHKINPMGEPTRFGNSQFVSLLAALGHKSNDKGVRCDSSFTLHYGIIHDLYTRGFVPKKELQTLANRTPHIV